MATITSSSTTAEIRAAYLDNVGYATDNSVAMAKAFVEACIAMQVRGISGSGTGANRMQFSLETLDGRIKEAKAFIASADGAGVIHSDFQDFRV